MSRFENVRILVIALAFVIASTSLVVWLPRDSRAFTPHDPIYIDGNGAFTPANGVTSGSGTPSDPFIIEGWDIDDWGNRGPGIRIMNTDSHFIIQNLLVHDAVWQPFGQLGHGIIFNNVANGVVESIETWHNYQSIILDSTRNINVSLSTFVDLGEAVTMGFSSNVSVYRNTVYWNGVDGRPDGIAVAGSSNVTIADNQILDGETGVEVFRSVNVTIADNRIESNVFHGVYVENSTGTHVQHNYFVNNGILIGGVQAYDDRGSDNSWDDGCSGGGNYWSDYNGSDRLDCSTGGISIDGMGDSPRVIDADSQDNYPLVSSSTADHVHPYWYNSSYVSITASAKQNYQGIRSIALWFRHSTDNATWSGWASAWSVSMPPWSWGFGFPDGEGYYEFYTIATENTGKVEPPPASAQAITGYDATPPSSSAIPISPYSHTAAPLVVDATASDGLSGVDSVTLFYSFSSDNNATWSPWEPFGTDTAPPWSSSFPFPDGQGHYRFHTIARDAAGNEEPPKSALEAVAGYSVPTEPPTTSLLIGWPNYTSDGTYVKSSTLLDFAVIDRSGFGIRNTTYTIDGGAPVNYTASGTFFLTGEGVRTIEWRSLDWAGNLEEIGSMDLTVDDTSPATTITQSDVQATTATVFNLTATDTGCGVNVTKYRIDGGSWIAYSGGFTLPEGTHNISYYSNDVLNNTESERWLVVMVKGTTIPPEVTVNYKPIVALMFACILLVAGVWSSKRRPWKGGKDRMAVAKAFMFTSLPFVLAEAATGAVSFLTGQLSIPPLIGAGISVDLAILLAGIVVAILRIMRTKPSGAEETSASLNR